MELITINKHEFYTTGDSEMMARMPEIELPEDFANYIATLILQVLEYKRSIAPLKSWAQDFIINKIQRAANLSRLGAVVRNFSQVKSSIHFESRCKAFVFSKIKFTNGDSETYMLEYVQRDKTWMIYEFDTFEMIKYERDLKQNMPIEEFIEPEFSSEFDFANET